MISTAIFSRYARALADVALEQNEDAEVRRDLETYREIFRAVPQLLDSFDSPAVPREAKGNVLKNLLARYPVGKTAGNFLHVLLDHHRLRYFEEIFDCYIKTVNERKGVVSAKVTSAVSLDERELSNLRDSLARATGKEVSLSVETDPELLGGLVVQIGSRVYDGSVRTQLDEMRRRLTGV